MSVQVECSNEVTGRSKPAIQLERTPHSRLQEHFILHLITHSLQYADHSFVGAACGVVACDAIVVGLLGKVLNEPAAVGIKSNPSDVGV